MSPTSPADGIATHQNRPTLSFFLCRSSDMLSNWHSHISLSVMGRLSAHWYRNGRIEKRGMKAEKQGGCGAVTGKPLQKRLGLVFGALCLHFLLLRSHRDSNHLSGCVSQFFNGTALSKNMPTTLMDYS